MAKINLTLSKKLFVPKFLPYLDDWSTRWFLMCGSAASGKSFFICQKILKRAFSEQLNILVCRRFATNLRHSCFKLFKEVITSWKLNKYVKINESDMRILIPSTGSEIIFMGLDLEEKLLSITNISVVWIEEAFQVEEEKIQQLNLRMRGSAANQQLLLSWNPISRNSYLYQLAVENPPASSIYIHSTYLDNPFIKEDYKKELDEMKIRNPNKYRVYGLGEWGIDNDCLVFTNWKAEDFNAMELAAKGLEHRAGIDIGFTDPTAIVDTLYDRNNKTIYIFNEFYKSGCQLDTIADALEEMGLRKTKLYCDSADPRAISYLRNKGFNAIGAAKGAGSVKGGIMFLQNHYIVIHPRCKKVIEEFENFQYIKDKRTGQLTENTTHEHSHSIDSTRYCYADIYTSNRIKTIEKSALNL